MYSKMLKAVQMVDDRREILKKTECLRKEVFCGVYALGEKPMLWSFRTNGPNPGWVCTGETGNCGCSHAEPRVLTELLAMGPEFFSAMAKQQTLIYTDYSPCQNCVNHFLEAQRYLHIDFWVYRHLAGHWQHSLDFLIKSDAVKVYSVGQLEELSQ